MKKLVGWILGILLVLGALATAAFFLLRTGEEEDGMHRYYLSQEEDRLLAFPADTEEQEPGAQVMELYVLQQSLPEKNRDEVKLLLPENVSLLNYSLENGLLTVNFSPEYREITREREILVRGGMVRLFTQISEVEKVQFLIDGEPLQNEDGTEIGPLTAGRFVENSGKEINSYIKTTMTLYFADKDGDALVPEERNVYYNSNVPLEKVVVEQLAKGPKDPEHMPVLPQELNILSVTIQEGICYVNLDANLKTLLEAQNNTLRPELAVYSIVNSLVSVCQVNKIQISVNGQTNVSIGSVDLGNLFSENPDLIKENEEE